LVLYPFDPIAEHRARYTSHIQPVRPVNTEIGLQEKFSPSETGRISALTEGFRDSSAPSDANLPEKHTPRQRQDNPGLISGKKIPPHRCRIRGLLYTVTVTFVSHNNLPWLPS